VRISRRHARRYAWSVPYFFWVRYSLGGNTRPSSFCLETCRADPLLQPFYPFLPIHKSRVQRWPGDLNRPAAMRGLPRNGRALHRAQFTRKLWRFTCIIPRTAMKNQISSLALSSAVGHPQPGWGNFAPGPAESGLSIRRPRCRRELDSAQFEPEKSASKGIAKWQP